MNAQEIENKIIASICKKQIGKMLFEEIVKGFEQKSNDFDPVKNCFEIEKYFGLGKGMSTSLKLLIKNGIVNREWLREYETINGNSKIDFKGLYVFIHKDRPFYVGISKGVIGRITQHVKGKNHNTSTLAYKIGLIRYKIVNGFEFAGKRKELDFQNEVEPVKSFLLKQRIVFIPIDNDEELSLFEIYCSMELGTLLNSFETH